MFFQVHRSRYRRIVVDSIRRQARNLHDRPNLDGSQRSPGVSSGDGDRLVEIGNVDQVKAAKPTMDFDGRYGATTGSWTTDMFVEAVYRTLKKG